MRPPPLLIALSLGANTALLAVLVARPAFAPPAFRDFFARGPSAEALATEARTRATADAQAATARATHDAASSAKLWSAFATDDVHVLVARLRSAGFPPAAIRSTVEAWLNTRLVAGFLESNRDLISLPYWKSQNPANQSGIWEQYNNLYRERARQMREILGDPFFAATGEITNEERRSFGNLPKAKVDLLQRINADYDEMQSQLRSSLQGVTLTEDRKKFLLLDSERRADLAAALTPEELTEYQMRIFSTSQRNLTTFTLMDATEDEFRAVYRVQQAAQDRQRAAAGNDGSSAPVTAGQRQLDQAQLARDLQTALGDQRYADYQRAANPAYQTLTSFAQRADLPIETVNLVFAQRTTVAQESVRIFDDPSQTPDQKRSALAALAQSTRAQMLSALGSTAGPAYLRNANRWLNALETGQAVTFDPTTGTTDFRKLPAPPPR